mmetsp:Transcript_24178/g.75203  ORF Transcript_24178/g.75203 Transcript_24178/m.75203 type:complete len:119 (-) Transcript_24178:84-440(-)
MKPSLSVSILWQMSWSLAVTSSLPASPPLVELLSDFVRWMGLRGTLKPSVGEGAGVVAAVDGEMEMVPVVKADAGGLLRPLPVGVGSDEGKPFVVPGCIDWLWDRATILLPGVCGATW